MREIVNDAVNDVVDIAHCINFASGVDRGHPCSVQLPPQHFSARALKDTLRHTCTFSYTCICGRCLGLHSVYRLCRLRCHCRRICTGQRLLPFVKKEIWSEKWILSLYIVVHGASETAPAFKSYTCTSPPHSLPAVAAASLQHCREIKKRM